MNLDCFSYWMDAMDARLTHGLLIKSIPEMCFLVHAKYNFLDEVIENLIRMQSITDNICND